jgi:uroporphyrinogen decarboxylase
MNGREQFLSVLNYEKPDVFPIMEFMGFWPEVSSYWADELGGQDIFEHFGLMQQEYLPIDFNFVPPFERIIIKETEHHIIEVDEVGVTKKVEKNSSAMPHYIDFPIKSRRDFESIKTRMNPLDYNSRYPDNWSELVKKYKQRNYPLGLLIRGPFAFCRDFMNFETLMMMVYDDIGLIRDMMNFQTDFTIQLFEKAVKEVDIDFLYLGEDMAYKTGSMFSPEILNQLVKPLYRKLSDFLRSNGIKHFIVDSDGCVLKLIPMYLDSGVTGILPVENTGEMDPVAIRRAYPKLQMIGGVNKLNIAAGGSAIDKEIGKVQKLVEHSGYIPSFDHSVPPIVSYENYKTYIEKLRDAVR